VVKAFRGVIRVLCGPLLLKEVKPQQFPSDGGRDEGVAAREQGRVCPAVSKKVAILRSPTVWANRTYFQGQVPGSGPAGKTFFLRGGWTKSRARQGETSSDLCGRAARGGAEKGRGKGRVPSVIRHTFC